MRLEHPHDGLERACLRVIPQAQTAIGDATLGGDAGGLDEYDTGAAQCEFSVVHQVKVVGYAVDRAVLRHGRNDDAVWQGDVTDFERGEQQGQRGGCGHRRHVVGGVVVAGCRTGAAGGGRRAKGGAVSDWGDQRDVYPPSSKQYAPVMNDAACEHRNSASVAISSGRPRRPIGCWAVIIANPYSAARTATVAGSADEPARGPANAPGAATSASRCSAYTLQPCSAKLRAARAGQKPAPPRATAARPIRCWHCRADSHSVADASTRQSTSPWVCPAHGPSPTLTALPSPA